MQFAAIHLLTCAHLPVAVIQRMILVTMDEAQPLLRIIVKAVRFCVASTFLVVGFVASAPPTTSLEITNRGIAFSGNDAFAPSNRCSVNHNLTAWGTSTHGDSATNFAFANCPTVPRTGLELTFTCPTNPPAPGELFGFTGTITNKGNDVVTSTVLDVYQSGSKVLRMPVQLLYPGQGANFSGSYLIPTNAYASGISSQITNRYVVVGYSSCPVVVSNAVTQICPLRIVRPQLELDFAAPNAGISWSASIAPGFVLQRNSDLVETDWLDVTNSPVVVSNRNQVILPASEARAFFRLKFQ